MSAFLAALARYWQPVAALAGALGVLLWGRHQRSQGAAQRETEIRAEAGARQTEAMTHATDAANRVRDADDAELERLRAKWRQP
ncbi:MAG TPA: hypothetical protein VGN96_14710 [Roseococcus sp.]|nr:hypothetical protein [Roseococcus sp.]